MANKFDYGLYWERKREENDQLAKNGVAHVSTHHSRIHVAAPFSKEFAAEAKKIGGRWKWRSHIWSFPGYARELVIQLCQQHWPGKVRGI